MDVLYFTNIPSPYKVDFLNELNKYVNVTCVFNSNSKDDKRDKRWYRNDFLFSSITIHNFAYKELNQLLSKNHYDIVVIAYYACINGAILMNILKRRKIKFFIAADGGFVNENDDFISGFLKKHFLSKASYYISSGKETDKYLTYYGAEQQYIYHAPLTSLRKKDILSNPLETSEKEELKIKFGYNEKRVFISVGNFIHRKGYDLFFEAIKNQKVDNTVFIIIGGGIEKQNYQKVINKYKLKNVELIDFCDKETLKKYYRMSDVFFFPSREDVWGLVINEAMSNGLPVISSNKVIAAKELIEESFLYDPYNVEDLASLIKKMLTFSNEKLFCFGQRNIKTIKDYTIENMANKYVEIFKEVLTND